MSPFPEQIIENPPTPLTLTTAPCAPTGESQAWVTTQGHVPAPVLCKLMWCRASPGPRCGLGAEAVQWPGTRPARFARWPRSWPLDWPCTEPGSWYWTGPAQSMLCLDSARACPCTVQDPAFRPRDDARNERMIFILSELFSMNKTAFLARDVQDFGPGMFKLRQVVPNT